MRHGGGHFLSVDEQQRVRDCVEQAEKTTSGEIVPLVVPASSHYPAASLLGALIVGLLAALAAAAVLSVRRPWGGLTVLDIWLFPAVFAASFLLSHEAIKALPRLRRVFITPAEIAEEVDETAFASFYRLGLANTRDRTGILIFVYVL
jgi:putative membrane protein